MQTRATCLILLASLGASCFAVFNAYVQKKQFYPSVVYLTKSNASLAVLYAQSLVLVYLLAQTARRLLFGELRAAESEHVTERAWYAVTETCLAFTVFRDDFSPRFVAQFVLLFVLKCFHWLAEDRVDVMERSPVITLLFHARLMSVLGLLALFDSYFVSHAYFQTLLRGASVQIVFGFEYAVLMTIVFYVAFKYVLHSLDSRNVHPWENKAVYILYADLAVNMLRVVLYFTFVCVMMRLHTFPLFCVRPLYLTLKSAKKAFKDIALSRRAVRYLQTLYPDAQPHELSPEAVCIICREEMTSGGSGQAKKLPCGHIFHTSCLRSWFQRQQTCPTCRLDIISATVVPAAGQPMPQPPPAAPAPGAFPNVAPALQPPFFAAAPPQAPFFAAAPPQPPYFAAAPPQAPFFAAAPPPQGAASSTQPAAPPFFFPPPMMMPPPAFLLPFPAPPNFSALTDEEVRRMEEDSRRGVEARVLALRNVQTLLDAAVVQLQQYLSILPPTLPTLSAPAQPSASSVQPSSSKAAAAAAESQRVEFDLGSDAAQTQSNQDEPQRSARENAAQSQAIGDDATPTTQEELMRQKRLERFSQNQLTAEQ